MKKKEDLGEGLTFDASSLIENALNLFFSIYVTSVHSEKNPNLILIYKILDLHKKFVMQALSRWQFQMRTQIGHLATVWVTKLLQLFQLQHI